MELRERRLLPALIGLGILAAGFALWIGLVLPGANSLNDFGAVGAALLAGVLCLRAARETDIARLRASWRWFGASAFAWCAGGLLSAYDELVRDATVPIPSFGDIGFAGALPCALIAILLFPASPRAAVGRARLVLDGVIISGSLVFIAWTTVLDSVLLSDVASTAQRTVILVYPVGELLIAGVGLSLLSRRAARRVIPLSLIICGLLAMSSSDVVFAFLHRSVMHANGNGLGAVGWFAGFLLLGLASVDSRAGPMEYEQTRLPSTWQLAFPYLPITAAIFTAVIEAALGRHFGIFSVVDGLVVVGAIVARQVFALEENRRLARELEATVTGLRQNQDALLYQGNHDSLTGMSNRYYLGEIAEAAFKGGRRDGRVAVIVCDIDRFKDVNDSLGQAQGDVVLVEISRRLRRSVPDQATIARIGGDEFAILLEDVANLEQPKAMASVLIKIISEPIRLGAGSVKLRASAGVAGMRRRQGDFDVLLRNANIALQEAKSRGGGEVRLFDRRLGEQFREQMVLLGDLELALDNGEFFLEYQPIVRTDDGQPVGAEALLRWRHPRRGVLYPDEFLSSAETSGIIVEIGSWVIGESLAQLAKWRDGSSAIEIWVAVNVSARQFVIGDLIGDVSHAIERSGLTPDVLRLEITESTLIDSAGKALEVLGSLHDLGVRLEIDDFGTGYSSLDYLKRLPIHAVKVDRSFVDGLGLESHDTTIVSAVIGLAHALSLEVIAEGVETVGQLSFLGGLDCDFIQGFYFSRPLDPAAFEQWFDLSKTQSVLSS